MIALLKSARILRRVLEVWDGLLSGFREKQQAKTSVKTWIV